MPTVSVDVGYVDVDVDLDDFDNEELVSELEGRGYTVLHDDDPLLVPVEPLTRSELEILQNLIDVQKPNPGSELYFIREKLSKQ
jgi:hypothetical protein